MTAAADGDSADEQTARDLNATLGDADQTASDAEQTMSETEQSLADHDGALAEADQRASNRDQAAADRDVAALGTAQPDRYAATRDIRRTGTLERESTAVVRSALGDERLELGRRRDETAKRRDELARLRDAAADAADEADRAAERAQGMVTTVAAARSAAARARARAAADRQRAARDREHAAYEREQAAEDRRAVSAAIAEAHLDDLTGAWRRSIGILILEREIARARRGDDRLALAFVDVNALKSINREEGHAAGDAVLRRVVAAIRSHLRSHDPIVRIGGDEFVCAAGETDIADLRVRFDHVARELGLDPLSRSISTGFAALIEGDTVDSLIGRADADLLSRRQS